MTIDRFRLVAYPEVIEAVCPTCGEYMEQVSNGFFSFALYCPKDETVCQLKLIKVPAKKVTKEYLEQCRKEVNRKVVSNE